jgi:hypothetical protein
MRSHAFSVFPLCLQILLSFSDQGKYLSEEELEGIIAVHDLNCNGVFDEVVDIA